MAATKSVGTTTTLLMLVVIFPGCSHGNTSFVETTCGQEVLIPNTGQESITVNLTFNQPQPNGVSCSWVIPAGNSSMSNQVVLTGTTEPEALACDKNPFAFSVSERDPDTGALNPLMVECMSSLVSRFEPVVGQPGFSMVVALNTTSALSESFIFMHVQPFVWSDAVCPRNERKVVFAHLGNKEVSDTFSPSSAHLLGRFPDNMLCKWDFRSPDEGVVNLFIRTFLYDSDSSRTCGGGDHFVVSDGNRSAAPIIVPICKNPGVHFEHASMAGSILVDMISDNSGGAHQSFYLQYWSVESCPSTPLVFEAYVGDEHHFKGSSYSPWGSGKEVQCQWRIVTLYHNVIKLYQLEAQEFQPNCDETKDYLLVNGQKISICNSSQFPVWSESKTMDITFHTNSDVLRSFVLNFTAAHKSPCQGYPQRKTITRSLHIGDYVELMPILQGDIGNGLVCQWIFTAKEEENSVKVAVDWAEAGSDDGVPFNKETCSFSNFDVYNGDAENSSAQITPTCSEDKSTIIYKSSSRSLLFIYHRRSGVAESGFRMEAFQVLYVSSGGSTEKDASFLGLTGLLAFLLAHLAA